MTFVAFRCGNVVREGSVRNRKNGRSCPPQNATPALVLVTFQKPARLQSKVDLCGSHIRSGSTFHSAPKILVSDDSFLANKFCSRVTCENVRKGLPAVSLLPYDKDVEEHAWERNKNHILNDFLFKGIIHATCLDAPDRRPATCCCCISIHNSVRPLWPCDACLIKYGARPPFLTGLIPIIRALRWHQERLKTAFNAGFYVSRNGNGKFSKLRLHSSSAPRDGPPQSKPDQTLMRPNQARSKRMARSRQQRAEESQ
ncbi:hypothetical protein JTE90_019852 [Oedothorax gibbosus]|uniref:Uncharacterized protein n=1 Tax=Oedothorax gibbosus TaxID=931172 RepID=A0AAV6VZU7_9ARAC|nr:hypothetical protein JTE90_019852 [Oedothorax gibbosus]